MPLHHEHQFTQAYIDEYAAEGASPLGRQIMANRWQMVLRHVQAGTLLDFGCGAGAFISAAPPGFDCHGYDVNPFSSYNVWRYGLHPGIVTFWDVLEHLRAPAETLNFGHPPPRWIFLCTPNVEDAPWDVIGWKHLKPVEHLYYFSRKSLIAMLHCAGYEMVEWNFDEGALRDPGRHMAIISMAARRRGC
jgi:hypothetical protein